MVGERDHPHGFGRVSRNHESSRLRLPFPPRTTGTEPSQTSDLAGSFVFNSRKWTPNCAASSFLTAHVEAASRGLHVTDVVEGAVSETSIITPFLHLNSVTSANEDRTHPYKPLSSIVRIGYDGEQCSRIAQFRRYVEVNSFTNDSAQRRTDDEIACIAACASRRRSHPSRHPSRRTRHRAHPLGTS